MKNVISILFILIFGFLSLSCSKDGGDDPSVVGEWELATWTINVPIDLNDDGITSTNLLDEATCDNSERLIFDVNGTVSSNATYNPHVTISLVDGTTDGYVFNVDCDTEGSIGIAGTYTQNGNLVTLFDSTASIDGNLLTIVYEDAIDIYDEDLSTVLTTKDLTLVYYRK
ncbi:MAG: hypothetical protein R2783_05945 [Gelidibacter sp.]